MKVVVAVLYAALAALALPAAASDSVHVKVLLHHSKHAPQQPPVTHVTRYVTRAKAMKKNLYHVSGSKAAFDHVLRKNPHLDVWRIKRVDGREHELQADILATSEAMEKLLNSEKGHHKTSKKGKVSSSSTHNTKLQLKADTTEAMALDMLVANDRKQVASCLYATKGYQLYLGKDKYTDSAYFDCFRPFDQIFEFFDTLAMQNPQFVTKIAGVAKTYEGRSIHAYKLATKSTSSSPKKALYTQSLLHAREWQGGASTHYTVASLLDDLRADDAATVKLFDEFDWYFVPVVNIDGYKYSWDVDRYWRVNRHPYKNYDGVDLNRNFPPLEYFDQDPSDLSSETVPGPAPLSEPESLGIYNFVMGIPGLAGVVDVHAFAGMVLRPFSDVQGEPQEPYGSVMKKMGDAVRDAMSPKDEFQYVSQTGGELYPAYGCVDDGFYRMTNFTVPALTIEVEGDDFIAPQNSIRDVASDIDNGLRQFAKEASTYAAFIQKLKRQTKK